MYLWPNRPSPLGRGGRIFSLSSVERVEPLSSAATAPPIKITPGPLYDFFPNPETNQKQSFPFQTHLVKMSLSSNKQPPIHRPHFSELHSRNLPNIRELRLPISPRNCSPPSLPSLSIAGFLRFPFRSDSNFPRAR